MYGINSKFPYICVPRDFVENKNISLETKGIALILLSYPDKINVLFKQIEKRFNYNKETWVKAIDELVSQGYMKQNEDDSYTFNMFDNE